MATEIAIADPELEELMRLLEDETGVPTPKSPAPVIKAASPVALSEEDAMLLELEGELTSTAPVTVPVKIAEGPLTGTAATELLAALEVVEVPVKPELSPDEELALLEAELNGAPAEPVKAAAVAVKPVEEERGLSFIPGEVLVDPETEVKPVEIEEPGIMAAGALADAGLIKDGQPVFDAKTMFALDPLAGGQYYTDPSKFRLETSINDVELDRCMIEQNGLRSYYGANAARAEAQAARLKVKFEVIEAKLYEEQRRLAAEDGEKITEKMLENRVKSTPTWLKAKLAVVDAQGVSDINRALVESLKDRKDMLVQLGADRRGEMQGAVRTMAASSHAQSERDRAIESAKNALQK